jgi:glucuronate isomerase
MRQPQSIRLSRRALVRGGGGMADAREIEVALGEIPILDVHTHLVGGKLAARGLHEVILYHMIISDLYAAGCPSGARLTEFPAWPTEAEARARIIEALPYLPHIRNTSSSWCARTILRDLYNWTEPIDERNWRRLDGLIRERSGEAAWPHEVLGRARIVRSGTELARRCGGADDDRLQYALEWGFFTRCQWGEYDTALYELERCWGKTPESPAPIGGGARPPTDRVIRGLDDVQAAVDHYVSHIPYRAILATATHLSTDIDYRMVSDREMASALGRRDDAGPFERDCYASYVNERFLTALESHSNEIVFQFSLGAEPLPYETGSRLSQRTIGQLAEMIGRHKVLRFQCFLASRGANQALCTLARELPNLSLAGYWWHNFFPDAIAQVMRERLDMVPANKQIGFFSDAYCVEWSYAKAALVRKVMARVLAERIELGQLDGESALEFARAILYDSPQSLLGMRPRKA